MGFLCFITYSFEPRDENKATANCMRLWQYIKKDWTQRSGFGGLLEA